MGLQGIERHVSDGESEALVFNSPFAENGA